MAQFDSKIKIAKTEKLQCCYKFLDIDTNFFFLTRIENPIHLYIYTQRSLTKTYISDLCLYLPKYTVTHFENSENFTL